MRISAILCLLGGLLIGYWLGKRKHQQRYQAGHCTNCLLYWQTGEMQAAATDTIVWFAGIEEGWEEMLIQGNRLFREVILGTQEKVQAESMRLYRNQLHYPAKKYHLVGYYGGNGLIIPLHQIYKKIAERLGGLSNELSITEPNIVQVTGKNGHPYWMVVSLGEDQAWKMHAWEYDTDIIFPKGANLLAPKETNYLHGEDLDRIKAEMRELESQAA